MGDNSLFVPIEVNKREDKFVRRPLASKLAVIIGIGLAIADFVFAFPSRPKSVDVGLWVTGFLFSAWQSLPMLMVGQMKAFWRYPVIYWLLLSVGTAVLVKELYEVYFAPHGSTAGLALIFGPLYVFVGYLVCWAMVKCVGIRES